MYRLRRKSFLDSSSKAELFSMHKLVLSFARERGADEMKETMLNSKARLPAFYFSIYVNLTLKNVLNNPKEASELCDLWISFHKMTLKQKVNLDKNLHQDGLLRSYLDRGRALHQMQNHLGAIQSFQRESSIAQRYFFLGENQLLVSSSVLSASS